MLSITRVNVSEVGYGHKPHLDVLAFKRATSPGASKTLARGMCPHISCVTNLDGGIHEEATVLRVQMVEVRTVPRRVQVPRESALWVSIWGSSIVAWTKHSLRRYILGRRVVMNRPKLHRLLLDYSYYVSGGSTCPRIIPKLRGKVPIQ